MSKKDFIALADAIREHNNCNAVRDGILTAFTEDHLHTLADFCQSQNSRFMRGRWMEYIAGKCGKNGGKIAA